MRRIRFRNCLAAAVIAGAVGFVASPSLAQVPQDLLELDGDLDNDNTFGTSFDWDDNLGAIPSVGLNFVNVDGIGGLQMTQGTKDNQDISDWVFKTVAKTSPPKDELLIARAAQVTDPNPGPTNEDFILYLAASRGQASGTTTFGFWVITGDVEIDPADGNSFSDDEHLEGDALIVVDVSGNRIAGVRIFEWQGGDGNAGSLVETFAAGEANCDAVGTVGTDYDADICGAVSDDGLFMEIGLNFSILFADRCIADLMATTRTSNSPSASVKNFTFNDFGTCSLSATKVCEIDGDGFNADFTAFTYKVSGMVNSDFGTLFDLQVYEDLTFDGPSADDVLIDELDMVGTTPVPWGPSFFESTTNAPSDEIYIIAAVSDGGQRTVVSDNAPATCPAVSASPSLSVDKFCRACLTVESNMIKVEVRSAGMVCNTDDIPLINVSVTDDHGTVAIGDDEIVSIGNLAVGQCKPYTTGPFQPATVNSLDPELATFMDEVTASAETTLGFPVADETASAMCKLCPPDGTNHGGIVCPALP